MEQTYTTTQKSEQYWIQKNKYYYKRLARFYSFYIPKNSRVLQVGCKSGFLLNQVKPSFGVGIDQDFENIKEAKTAYPHLQFYEGDLDALSKTLKDTKFEYVILSFTLMLEDDIQLFLEKLKKFCDSSTRIVINIYSFLWQPILSLSEKFGLKQRSKLKNWVQLSDLQNLLDLSNYEIIYKEHQTLFPKNIPLITQTLNNFVAHIPIIEKLCLDQFIVARVKFDKSNLIQQKCSIIVTCKNEFGNIQQAIERIPNFGSHTEVIFVEGGSNDGTAEEIKKQISIHKNKENFSFIFHRQTGKGKGNAVREGFAAATGEVLMILDGDLTTPPEELEKFWNALISDKGEFINGVRFVYPREKKSMRHLNFIANKLFSFGFSWLLNQKIKDTLCGTKVLYKKDWEKILEQREFLGDFDPFGDFDLIFGASKQNLKIIDIPIHYKDRTYGTSQIRRFTSGILLLKMSFIALIKFKLK